MRNSRCPKIRFVERNTLPVIPLLQPAPKAHAHGRRGIYSGGLLKISRLDQLSRLDELRAPMTAEVKGNGLMEFFV